MSKYIKYQRSGLGQLAPSAAGSSLGPISSGFNSQQPGPYASGYVYPQEQPKQEDNSTLNSVLSSVTSIIASVGTAAATGYAAKLSVDAQKAQIKAIQAAANVGPQQPIVIQQSNTGLMAVLGIGGLIVVGGILFVALKK